MYNICYCRNSKSSQQVVDFIRARLFESGSSLQHSEPERLATICESVSFGLSIAQKVP